MSNDYQSGAAPSAQMSHAELISEMRYHGQLNIDEEKGKSVNGILTVEGHIFKDYADDLDAAHKRELDAKDSVIQALRAELRQAQEKREITIAAQKAKAAAEGYADGKRDATYNNATVPSVSSDTAKLREALLAIMVEIAGYCHDGEPIVERLTENPPDYTLLRDSIIEISRLAKAALASVGKEH